MTALVQRYWTDPVTCVRHWFWTANTHAPEIVRAALSCIRAASLAAPLLGPIVPALVVPVGAPAIVQPYPEFRGAGYQVPATAGISAGASDAAGFAPVFPAAPYAAAIKAASPAGTAPGTGNTTIPGAAYLPPLWVRPIAPSGPEQPAPIPSTPAFDDFDVPNLLIPVGPAVDVPEQPVPEPSSLALLGPACVALGVLRRWGGYP